jgi:hypothetical protein
MLTVGFEPTTPAGERPQTYALDRAAACICSYLKSILRYKLLILHTSHPDTLHLCEDVRIRRCFSKPKGIREHNGLGNTAVRGF